MCCFAQTQKLKRRFDGDNRKVVAMVSVNQENKTVAFKISLKSLSADAYLTPREQGILAEIVEGHSSKEVARSFDISPRTVEFHRANLLKKFDAKNTADLVRKVSGG
jgi:DNA-binding CsgD family transcriptional regulator